MAKRKKSCGSRGRFKSGKRKGRCRPKKHARKSSRRSTRRVARRKPHCVKVRGQKRAIRCYGSAKAALKKAARLRAKGKEAIVRGGKTV